MVMLVTSRGRGVWQELWLSLDGHRAAQAECAVLHLFLEPWFSSGCYEHLDFSPAGKPKKATPTETCYSQQYAAGFCVSSTHGIIIGDGFFPEVYNL